MKRSEIQEIGIDEFDSTGRWVARTYGEDPKSLKSWRNE